MDDCTICGGSAHVPDGYRWKRCVCFDMAERDRRCRAAGIPEAYWKLRIREDLLAPTSALVVARDTLATMSDRIKQNGLSGRYCLIGAPRSIRTIGYLMLRAALYRVEGDGFATRTDELSNSYLHDKDRVTHRRARGTRALLLLAGVEYPNKLDRHVVETLLRDRDDPSLGTIVTASLSPAELQERYGDDPLWRSPVVLPQQDFA